jgi:simple sugar transport system substrate-binding protein
MRRLAILCGLLLVIAGCGVTREVREKGVQVSGAPSSTPAPGAPVPDGAVRIAVVTHGPASSKFWAIIRNGVDSAARRLDVLVDYKSPDVFSVERMSELIDQAVATKPDGLVVSIPSDALAPAIRRAVKAGIPVVSINSGSDVFRRLGVLVHVGQVEDRAGLEAGRRLADAGVRNALCLNQDEDNKGVDARCKGLEKAMREVAGRARVLPIVDDDPRTPSLIAAAVKAGGVDGVLATNSLGGLGAAKGLAGTGVKIGTFDLGPDVLKAVRAGAIDFAVDQQAYLQGYLPIEMLALRARYGILPSQHDVVATGPNFVTRENAAQALELSERSIR